MRFIAKNSNSTDTKNILDFLSYSKDQMRELIQKDISQESISSMLDISNTILEGAKSIHNDDINNIKFHLAKISKLYMSINLNFDPKNSKNTLKKEIELIDTRLKFNPAWISCKELLNKTKCFTPNIISILMQDLQNSVGKI